MSPLTLLPLMRGLIELLMVMCISALIVSNSSVLVPSKLACSSPLTMFRVTSSAALLRSISPFTVLTSRRPDDPLSVISPFTVCRLTRPRLLLLLMGPLTVLSAMTPLRSLATMLPLTVVMLAPPSTPATSTATLTPENSTSLLAGSTISRSLPCSLRLQRIERGMTTSNRVKPLSDSSSKPSASSSRRPLTENVLSEPVRMRTSPRSTSSVIFSLALTCRVSSILC